MTSAGGGCDVANCGLCTTPAMFMVSRTCVNHSVLAFRVVVPVTAQRYLECARVTAAEPPPRRLG